MPAATTPAVPLTFGECAATLRRLGWTERQADWLTLVCLHSGVFTRNQYQARYNVTAGRATRFVRALMDAGVAREAGRLDRRAYRPTSICQVHGRSLYRALGIEDDRHRRSASPELTMRRLLSLDYVLERPELGWLATEPEKLAYFQRLGIPLAVLPHRLHRRPFADRPTRRYFPLKLPIAGNATTTTFVYADPGGRRGLQTDRIRSWVAAHAAVWDALRDGGGAVHVVAVTRTEDAAAANVAILETWRGPPAPPVPRSETDQQLLDAVALAHATGDLSLLDKHGGWLEAGRAAYRIRQHEKDARGPPKYVDAYSAYVAKRLTPDLLARSPTTRLQDP